MTKASDNEFPKILIKEGTTPSSPSSGDQKLFIDSADHHLKRVNSSGTVTALEGAAGAVVTSPTIVAAGTSATGTGAVTPGLPTGHTTSDILLLFVQSDNETVTAPAGYTQLGPVAGLGTAAAASATRLSVFWKRDGGSEAAPTVADSGDHTLAVILAIRGCPTSGDPFVCVGAGRKATASTTGAAPAGATTIDNCLVVTAFAHALDSASAVFSGWTNADLASVTEQIDVATTDGNGGGIGVATGILAAAGPFRATTVTETSTVDVSLVFYMVPGDKVEVGAAARIDRQVFLTPGFVDTWTKPTGAKLVDIVCIGGGASGSAGRNAATAAGGGGGGGGLYIRTTMGAAQLPATLAVTAGAGGAATANSDGAASNAGNASQVTASGIIIAYGWPGGAAGASASNSGGLGGNGGGPGTALAASTTSYTIQPPGGGTGGTTAGSGGSANGDSGSAGAGGGTTQGVSTGGSSLRGGAGGGGGRSNTNVGTGGPSLFTGQVAGGATAGAVGGDSPYPEFGGAGGAGGTSAAGAGGAGGWPGGGGGGSQSGAQRGGAGGDGVVVITTFF